MKYIIRLTLTIVLVCLCCAIITGLTRCDKDNKGCKEWEQTTIAPQALLNIAWGCAGHVDVKSCKIKNNEHALTLIFYEDESLSGRTCNHLIGNYKADFIAGTINISIHTTTEMLCPPSVGEKLSLETLKKVQFFSVEENELRLYYNNKQNYLLFKPY